MTNKKMTNAMALEVAIEVLKATDLEKYGEVVEKLDKILEQTNKKSSANKKPTATQVENEKLKVAIVDNLAGGDKMTVTDMMKKIPELADLTNQRVTSLVSSLVKEGKLKREVEKRKAFFSVADTEEEESEEMIAD